MSKHFYPALAGGLLAVRAEADPVAMITALNRDWEQFKGDNAQKDKELKAKFDDVVTTEKLGRVEASIAAMTAALDDANAKIAGFAVNGNGSGGDGLSDAERDYSAAFSDWFRTGEGERALKLKASEGGISAAYSVGTDSEGGYTAPIEWDRTITDKRIEVSPMRRFASVQSVSGQGFKRLSAISTLGTVWRDCVAEGLRLIFISVGVEDDEEPKDRASETRDDQGPCRASREGHPACDAQVAFF